MKNFHKMKPSKLTAFFANREPLFEFKSLEQWVIYAQRWFRQAEHTSADTICIDSKGRIADVGSDFSRAEREGTYPIKAYSTRELA